MTAPTFLIGDIGHYCNRNDVTRWYITCQYAAVYTSIPWFICGKKIALNVLFRTYMLNFRNKTSLHYRLKSSERILFNIYTVASIHKYMKLVTILINYKE